MTPESMEDAIRAMWGGYVVKPDRIIVPSSLVSVIRRRAPVRRSKSMRDRRYALQHRPRTSRIGIALKVG